MAAMAAMAAMATNPPLDIEDEMFDEHGKFKEIDAAFARYRQPVKAVAAEFADFFLSR